MARAPRKFLLDTNCFVDAARGPEAGAAFAAFCAQAAPGLYLSAIVAAELRAGARPARVRQLLEEQVLGPYVRRGRVVVPSAAAWDALGTTLAVLRENEGLDLREIRRSFIFDVLLAYSARELGAILVSRNTRDLSRIARVFSFKFAAPYPALR